MVSFASQPQPEPQVEAEEDPQLKNPKDPFETFDAQSIDFSFADSFLDFDSMHDWFEDKPIPDMATQDDDDNNNNNNDGLALGAPSSLQVEQGTANGSDPYDVGSTHAVKVKELERENLGTSSGCAIEEGMGKISLVGGCGSSVRIEGNGDNNAEITNNEDKSEGSESESGSTSSSSSSTSYESSSSSDSEDDDDDDDDDEEDEQEDEKREGPARRALDVEFEEGEIRDSDGQAAFTETAAIDDGGDDDDVDSEDAEKMASWSIVSDDEIIGGHDDDDDGNAAKGPIRSKNELEMLPSVPPVDVRLEPHHQMLPVGVVMSIVGTRVIVEGLEKHDPLNEGSILWITESRTPLGFVDEIFGPVKNPYYVARYNSEKEVPAGIHGGSLISFVPEFANHVLNNKDLYKKGYDASGVNDEEVSDESDFSDDEKEAEYKRMQRMAKRGTNDQNPGKRKNNRKKVSPKEAVVPTFSVAPATPLLDHGYCSPFSGIGRGIFGGTTLPPTNPSPNLSTSGVWTNGTTFAPHSQSQPILLPNGFPANGISWYPENNQISHQLPVPGNPFQQQLNAYQQPVFPSVQPVFPGVQPNIFAQPMYAQGLVGQNQMPFGLNSPLPQIQPPMFAGQQGFLSSELHSERNRNVHSGSVPGNHHAPHQFHPGPSASRGRTFHRRGRKGWRTAK